RGADELVEGSDRHAPDVRDASAPAGRRRAVERGQFRVRRPVERSFVPALAEADRVDGEVDAVSAAVPFESETPGESVFPAVSRTDRKRQAAPR
ncbi:hypothetical protein BRD10_00195, partial [Halobacteriales archaeon SW_12_71_31]